jgi:hypothetical protein
MGIQIVVYAFLSPMTTNKTVKKGTGLPRLISDLAEIQLKVNALPPLSGPEKAKFDNSLAIDQLYNSSKVEGTTLTDTMIEHAIYCRKLPSS